MPTKKQIRNFTTYCFGIGGILLPILQSILQQFSVGIKMSSFLSSIIHSQHYLLAIGIVLGISIALWISKFLPDDDGIRSFLTDKDIEQMAMGHHEKKTKTFFYRGYKRGGIPLDQNFKNNYEKYTPINLDRVPMGAKSITISFEIFQSKAGLPDLHKDYQCSFFIKKGNGREKVDEKSNKFVLGEEYLEKKWNGLWGSKDEVLCFYFCAEIGDKSILKMIPEDSNVEPNYLQILIKSCSF